MRLSLTPLLAAACFTFSAVALTPACTPKQSERTTSNPDVIDEYEEEMPDDGMYEAPMGGFTPEGILSAVSNAGGLTKLPKGLAASVLNNYIERLDGVPAAKDLLPDLNLIKDELNSGIIDRGDVGAALQRLATGTRQVAGDGSPYNALASALELSGNELVGM